MQKKKFRSPTTAKRFATALGMIAHKGAATKLKDGTKANWYTFTKYGKKKRK